MIVDHCRYLRRGAALQLRIDAYRLVFAMPIHEDTSTAIAYMPFSGQVLVVSTEFLRIRCAGRIPFAPNCRLTDGEGGVGDFGNRLAQGAFAHEALLDVQELLVADVLLPGQDPFQPRVGAQAI